MLAKMGSPSVVGQFALASAVAAPVFMFTNLQLRALQATDARSEYSFADYFTLRFVSTAIGLLAIGILVLGVSYDFRTRVVISLVAASKAVECFGDVIAGLLQKVERLDVVSVGLMIRGLLSVFAFGLAFMCFGSLVMACAAMAVVWLAVLLLYDVRWAALTIGPRAHFLGVDWGRLKRLFMVSLPLGIVMTMISLNINIPRYVLQHYLGSADLGIFASLASVVVIVNLVVNALGQSATTRLSRMFADGEFHDFRLLVGKLAALGALLIVIGVPLAVYLGRPTLTFLYRPEYGDHVSLLALMVATSGFNAVGSFLGYGMTAARRFRAQVPVIIVSTLTAAIGSILLVPQHGLIGAAVALLVSAVALVLGYAVALSSALKAAAKGDQ